MPRPPEASRRHTELGCCRCAAASAFVRTGTLRVFVAQSVSSHLRTAPKTHRTTPLHKGLTRTAPRHKHRTAASLDPTGVPTCWAKMCPAELCNPDCQRPSTCSLHVGSSRSCEVGSRRLRNFDRPALRPAPRLSPGTRRARPISGSPSPSAHPRKTQARVNSRPKTNTDPARANALEIPVQTAASQTRPCGPSRCSRLASWRITRGTAAPSWVAFGAKRGKRHTFGVWEYANVSENKHHPGQRSSQIRSAFSADPTYLGSKAPRQKPDAERTPKVLASPAEPCLIEHERKLSEAWSERLRHLVVALQLAARI